MARSYKPDPAGFRELGRSAAMGSACLDAARRVADQANAVGSSTYEAVPDTVRAGWSNEARAGAVVREVVPDWRDWRDATLVTVTNAMGRRG